jgi:hypothetical protein
MKRTSHPGRLLGMLLVFYGLEGNSSATTTFDVEVIPGVTQFATAIVAVDSTISNRDMLGMRVEAFFSTPTGELVIPSHWSSSAGGHVSRGDGTLIGFQLTLSGSTIGEPWILRNDSHPDSQAVLKGIRIDGFGHPVARTVFDLTFGGAIGTAGSGTGRDFYADLDLGFPLHVVATYRDQVAVLGDAPLGDLYRALELDLGDGLSSGLPLYFFLDTDNVRGPIPVDPPGAAPEPGTLLLVGAGVAALHRRRRL